MLCSFLLKVFACSTPSSWKNYCLDLIEGSYLSNNSSVSNTLAFYKQTILQSFYIPSTHFPHSIYRNVNLILLFVTLRMCDSILIRNMVLATEFNSFYYYSYVNTWNFGYLAFLLGNIRQELNIMDIAGTEGKCYFLCVCAEKLNKTIGSNNYLIIVCLSWTAAQLWLHFHFQPRLCCNQHFACHGNIACWNILSLVNMAFSF